MIGRHRRPPLVHRAPIFVPALWALLWASVAIVIGGPATAGASPTGQAGSRSSLVSQSATVAGDDRFQITISTTLPEPTTARLRVHRRVTNRTAFASTLRPDADLGAVIATTDAVEVPPGAASRPARVSLDLAVGTDGTPLADGVYPVEVEFTDRTGASVDSLVTHLVRIALPERVTTPLSVAVVVPLTADATLTPARIVVDQTATEELAAVTDVLAAHRAFPLTAAPQPDTVYALSEGDGSRAALLRRMVDAVDERPLIAAPFTRLDTNAWVMSGHGPELGLQLETGALQVAGSFGTEPVHTWWIGSEPLNGLVVDALAAEGIERIIAPARSFEALDETDFPVALLRPFAVPGGDAELTGFALDDQLIGHLGSLDDGRLAAHRLLADLAVLYFDRPNLARSTIIAPPPAQSWNPAELDIVLTALRQHSLIRPVSLEELADEAEPARSGGVDVGEGPELQRSFVSPEPAGDVAGLADELGQIRQAIETYSTVIGPDRTELAPLRISALSVADRELEPTTRSLALAAIERKIAADLTGRIELPVEAQITLTSRDGEIPITLRANDPSRNLTVLVQLASDKLEFPEGAERTVTIGGGVDSVRLDVPVRTRGSGAFPLRVEVTSLDGSRRLATADMAIRSATFSGVGLALSVSAGLFLIVWWARHALRVRTRPEPVVADGP